MSEFHVQVFKLGKVGKHPNADTLSITQGPTGYPVVFKSGEFNAGDLAVHIPIDALVDTALPQFSWLTEKASLAGDGRWLFRVKACKLRGVPSYGFLVPLEGLGEVVPGQDVREQLKVTKFDPGPCYEQNGIIQGEHMSLPQEGIVPLYDIEGMRKNPHIFLPGEAVWVTEKVHGSNGRWVVLENTLYCGSRTKFRKDSVWNKMAVKYNLEEKLRGKYEGLVLYGEVIGPGIQDLTYGLVDPEVLFFDAYNSRIGRWMDSDVFCDLVKELDLPIVPTLYDGPFDYEAIMAMAEGPSTIPGANHVREGIVVKPWMERWHQDIGRAFLKLPGEGYLLRKQSDGP